MNRVPAPNDEGVTPEKPWLGLRSFSEEVRGYFFGRDSELLDLFERVEHKPLTVLFGRSGLGKTSLLHAGLLPRLRDAGFLPVDLRLRYDDAPPLGQQVIDEIRSVLDRAGLPPLPPLPPDTSLWLLFHDRACGIAGTDLRFVLVFDQFEEIFTLGDEQLEASRAFRDALAAVVENRVPDAVRERLEKDDALAERLVYSAGPCRVLLSLRDDFLHRLERWRRHMPSLMENRVELRPLTGPQALEAVEMPGRMRCAVDQGAPNEECPPIVSKETAAAIVRFVAGAGADLPIEKIETVPPLLSLICAELNEARIETSDATIRVDQLQGKADSILERFYNDCFAEHPPALRKFVEEFLLSKEGYRESVAIDTPLHELEAAKIPRDDARRMLYDLIDRRLLAVEERGNVRRLELTHDVLIGVAKRSRDTRHEREEREATERKETERAKRAQAEADERARRRKRQHRRWLVAGLLLLAGVFVIAFITHRANQAVEEKGKQVEEKSGQVLEAARGDQATALAFFEQGKWREGIAYLGRSLSFDPDSGAAAKCLWMAVVYGRGERHPWPLTASHDPAPIVCAAANPDFTRVFTASADKTATICDREGKPGKPFALSDVDAKAPDFPTDGPVIVNDASFSPDGSRVLIVNNAGRAWVLDVNADPPTPIPLAADASVLAAAFTDGGASIVATGRDKSLRRWSADGTPLEKRTELEPPPADAPPPPSGDQVPAKDVEKFNQEHPPIFSADGSRVAILTGYKTLRTWEVATGRLRCTIETPQDWLIPTDFSPDGRLVVTMDANRDVRIWDEATAQSPAQPLNRSRTRAMPHEAHVQSAIFSPDGLRLVTVCGDDEKSQTARVWNARDGTPLDVALDHEKPICAIGFSADGSRILTVDDRRIFRSWNPVAGYTWGEPVFGANGDARLDEAMRVSPPAVSELFAKSFNTFHRFAPASFARNQEHRLVATCQADSVGIWDDAGAPLSPPLLYAGTEKFAGFDRAGREIITASSYHPIRTWNLPGVQTTMADRDWIEKLARAISRLKFGPNQILQPVGVDEDREVGDAHKWPRDWFDLLNWSLDPKPERPFTPAPEKTGRTTRSVADELLQHLEFKFDIISEVLVIDPTNPRLPEAVARLDREAGTVAK